MQKGQALILILVGLLILAVIAGGTYYFGKSPTPSPVAGLSGISGKITLGPTCPVVGGDMEDECQDKSYQATVIVKAADGKKEITQFTSDKNGNFRVELQPGTYLLESEPGKSRLPFSKPQTITVESGKYTQVTISYDTGIR